MKPSVQKETISAGSRSLLQLSLPPSLPLVCPPPLFLISTQSVEAAATVSSVDLDLSRPKLPEQHGPCKSRVSPVSAGGRLAPGGRQKWQRGWESREFHGR